MSVKPPDPSRIPSIHIDKYGNTSNTKDDQESINLLSYSTAMAKATPLEGQRVRHLTTQSIIKSLADLSPHDRNSITIPLTKIFSPEDHYFPKAGSPPKKIPQVDIQLAKELYRLTAQSNGQPLIQKLDNSIHYIALHNVEMQQEVLQKLLSSVTIDDVIAYTIITHYFLLQEERSNIEKITPENLEEVKTSQPNLIIDIAYNKLINNTLEKLGITQVSLSTASKLMLTQFVGNQISATLTAFLQHLNPDKSTVLALGAGSDFKLGLYIKITKTDTGLDYEVGPSPSIIPIPVDKFTKTGAQTKEGEIIGDHVKFSIEADSSELGFHMPPESVDISINYQKTS